MGQDNGSGYNRSCLSTQKVIILMDTPHTDVSLLGDPRGNRWYRMNTNRHTVFRMTSVGDSDMAHVGDLYHVSINSITVIVHRTKISSYHLITSTRRIVCACAHARWREDDAIRTYHSTFCCCTSSASSEAARLPLASLSTASLPAVAALRANASASSSLAIITAVRERSSSIAFTSLASEDARKHCGDH